MPSYRSHRGLAANLHDLAPWARWTFIVLVIVTMLVCLPEIHYATGLHNTGIPLDAFDQGVNVAPSTLVSIEVVLLGALLLGGLMRSGPCRHAREIASGIASWRCVLMHLTSSNPHTVRMHRRTGISSSESDDASASNHLHATLGMSTTLGFPRTLGTRGSFLSPLANVCMQAHARHVEACITRLRDGPQSPLARGGGSGT